MGFYDFEITFVRHGKKDVTIIFTPDKTVGDMLAYIRREMSLSSFGLRMGTPYGTRVEFSNEEKRMNLPMYFSGYNNTLYLVEEQNK